MPNRKHWNTPEFRALELKDVDLAYRILETTMRGYAEQTYGLWKEAAARESVMQQALAGTSQIIEYGGADAGLVLIERHATHVQLEQLFVLPQYQGHEIGTFILNALMKEASLNKLPVQLRVLAVNPARNFYAKMGFTVVRCTREQFFMTRTP